MSNTADIASLINKPTTCNNIPAKIIVDTIDICAPIIFRIYNDSISSKTFPGPLKIADITLVRRMKLRLQVITDLLVFFPQYRKYSRELCIIKFRLT